MMGEGDGFEPIRFDEIVVWTWDADERLVVTHRDPEGKVIVYHSPLDNGAIKCSICESGVRVYMAVDE